MGLKAQNNLLCLGRNVHATGETGNNALTI